MTCRKCGHTIAGASVLSTQSSFSPAAAVPARKTRPGDITAAGSRAGKSHVKDFPGVEWSIWECAIYGALILGTLILSNIVLKGHPGATAFGLLAYAIALFAPIISMKYHGQKLSSLGFTAKGFRSGMLLTIVVGFLLFFLSFISTAISIKLFMPKGVGTQFSFFSSLLAAVVLAPISEETYFRGYLYPALRNRMNMPLAMLLDGLIFASFHLLPGWQYGFASRAIGGMGLSYLYEKTGSLYSSMLVHAVFNLGIILAGVFFII